MLSQCFYQRQMSFLDAFQNVLDANNVPAMVFLGLYHKCSTLYYGLFVSEWSSLSLDMYTTREYGICGNYDVSI